MYRTILFGKPYYLVFILFFFSCKLATNNSHIVKELEMGLQQSNESINKNNEDVLAELDARASDPKTKEKARLWLPKAQLASQLSQAQIHYIDSLKFLLLKDSTHSASDLISKGNLALELFTRLKNYKQKLLNSDPKIREMIGELIVVNKEYDSTTQAEQFKQRYFQSTNRLDQLAYLTKLQNNIFVAENKCLHLCLDQTAYLDGDSFFTAFEAIVGQNTQVLKVGNELEITAGLGRFSKKILPKITIGGKLAKLNDRGFVVYKMKSPKKPGKYSVPVLFEFTDQDSLKQKRRFTIDYFVVEKDKNN